MTAEATIKKRVETIVNVKGSRFYLVVNDRPDGYAAIEERETMRCLVVGKDEIRNLINMLTEAEKLLSGNAARKEQA
ncbi:hypothetical protein [Alcaligenes faecalis]|uniref:Uncharacterized protein n=1 Tax=Alcaligenes faecalis TaxID=511 RepID=A0AAE9H681_ALCFA|nr:hypothetical protein [Alcaligenes faecalis]UPL20235.1 hypothetical protein MXF72_12445 [Alcaligenes faecalis]